MSLAVLVTSHNRREKTVQCLSNLISQELLCSVNIDVYVVDDASVDGTSAVIKELFPSAKILSGNGSLFWNGGMRLAFDTAARADYEHYLWLNDDTLLFPDAVTRLLVTSAKFGEKAIIVGSTQDPKTGLLTYGGVKRLNRYKPLKFTRISPSDYSIPVETMNGNCVLIPRIVAKMVGNLDQAFTHSMGDYDYGLRARKFGIEIYVAPNYYGYCQRNASYNTRQHTLKESWRYFVSYKGLPPREWAIFAKRYAGALWPLYWLFPYLRAIANLLH